MKEIFSYTKLFTILLAIFYIIGLISCFYDCKLICFLIVFLLLSLLVWFCNLGFKKSLILCAIFLFGVLRAQNSMNLPAILDDINSNNAKVFGQIITSKDVSRKDNKTKFFLRANSALIDNKKYENLNTKILVSIDNYSDFSIGDYVVLEGKLRMPKPSSNPYQFDYQRYLLNE